MNAFFKYPIFVLAIITLAGCKNKSAQQTLKPEVIGQAGEVIVVMSQGKWQSIAGDTMRSILLAPEIGLPREEPLFDPIFIPSDGFGALYRKHRNILFAKIGPDFKERKVTIKKGVYAKSQIIITVQAPSDTAFANFVHKNRLKLTNLLQDSERKRLMETYKTQQEVEVVNMLKQDHNINLIIPKGYKINLNEPGFIWLENEHRDIIENIAIYYYKYTDDSTFTKDYQVKKRNAYLRKIPGQIEGSYVSTEERAPLYFNAFNMNDIYTVQLRGLWRINDGMAMGGPFINMSQYDESRNRIVTIEGFVFAPAHKKRNYIRRAEAIMYSINYPEKEAN